MGLLARLMFKGYGIKEWTEDIRAWIHGQETLSGTRVSEQTAMRFITIFGCVGLISDTFGGLPAFIYRARQSGGGADKAFDHPLYDLLHAAPNDEMASMTFRQTLMGHRLLSGNCYAIITTNRRGQTIDLYPVPWTQMTPSRDEDTRRIVYDLNDRGKTETLPADKVFHVPGLGFDGIRGYSVIRMNAGAVGLGQATSEFLQRFYGQGMNVGGVLETDKVLNDKAFERLKKEFEERGSGLANSWKPLILEEGMKYARIPMPFVDAQLVETLKLNEVQIAAGLFHVPPHMIGNLDRATFSNIEHQNIEFVTYTLLSHLVIWEQTINRKLLTRKERESGYYARFNVGGLLRGDAKSQAEALHIMRQDGVINGDEWRDLLEMNPQEGGVGRIYFINGNMIPVETAAKQQRPRRQVDPTTQPVVPGAMDSGEESDPDEGR